MITLVLMLVGLALIARAVWLVTRPMRQYLRLVARARRNPRDGELFARVVDEGMRLLKLDAEFVAARMHAAPGTIERWRTRQALPYPDMRPEVCNWFEYRARRYMRHGTAR